MAAASLLACAGSASAAGVELAGHNEFEASRAGYVAMHLSSDLVPLPEDKAKWMRFDLDGEGWIRFLELRSLQRTNDGWWSHPTVQVMRFEGCGALAVSLCSKGDYLTMAFVSKELPAGDYYAYVLTQNGKRAKGVLDFPTLSGSQQLTADQPAAFTERTPLATNSLGPTTSFGTSGRVEGDGLAMMRVRTHSDTPSADRTENCIYWDEPARAQAVNAYTAGCEPGLLNTLPLGTPSFPRYGEDYLLIGFADHAYDVGIGGNVTTGGLPAPVEAHAGFLTYAGQSQAPGPQPPPAQPAGGGGLVVSPGDGAQSGPVAGVATLGARAARVRGANARVTLACHGEGRCRGFLGFVGSRRLTAFNIPGARRTPLRLAVPRKTLHRLRRKRRVLTRLLVRSDLGQTLRDEHRRVRLVAPRRR